MLQFSWFIKRHIHVMPCTVFIMVRFLLTVNVEKWYRFLESGRLFLLHGVL